MREMQKGEEQEEMRGKEIGRVKRGWGRQRERERERERERDHNEVNNYSSNLLTIRSLS